MRGDSPNSANAIAPNVAASFGMAIRTLCARMLLAAATAAMVLPLAPEASADPIAVVNTIRNQGCAAQPTESSPVRPDSTLNEVARELSRGRELSAALERAAYPAARSTSLHVKGSRADATIREMLAERFCAGVNDPRYTELGVFQKGDETWIVLAVRTAPRPILEPIAVGGRVLELVNAARGEARTCGRDRYEAAGPLTLSTTLNEAASLHARDMARRGSLGHEGSDGSSSGDRITRVGYVWQASGENIAAGQRDADTVVAGWLASPGHCATLMAPYFTETGVAFTEAPESNPSIYWVQVFATPR